MAPAPPYAEDVSEEVDSSSTEKVHDEKSPLETTDNVTVQQVQDLADKIGETSTGLAPVDDIEHVMDKVDTLTMEECEMHIRKLLDDHKYDYNFAAAQRQKLEAMLEGPTLGESTEDWELKMKTETAINKFYSP